MECEIGSTVGGRYRIERALAEGGMGRVFAGQHLGLGEPVAIKLLKVERASPRDIARFEREARAAARIRGENVVRVLDVGFEEGRPYIVMELVDGVDLATHLKAHGPVEPALAVAYVLQACEALAEAHRLEVVHRDLKPSNLLLTRRPDGSPLIKVSDFGIAKVEGPATSLTETRDVLGSPKYMSPEQVREAHDVDVRSDVWSLGVTLYELLSDALPFDAFTAAGIIARIASDPPAPLDDGPALDPALVAVVFRCLEKDRERRYRDVAELARALAPFSGVGGAASAERVEKILRRSIAPARSPSAPDLERTAADTLESTTPLVSAARPTALPVGVTSLDRASLVAPLPAAPVKGGASSRGRVVVIAAIAAVTLGAAIVARRASSAVTPAEATTTPELAEVHAEAPSPAVTIASTPSTEPPPLAPVATDTAPIAAPSHLAVASRPTSPSPARTIAAASAPPATAAARAPIAPATSGAPVVDLPEYGPRK